MFINCSAITVSFCKEQIKLPYVSANVKIIKLDTLVNIKDIVQVYQYGGIVVVFFVTNENKGSRINNIWIRCN